MSQQPFQTEVSQLLKLIIHSLYSHKEIFLRELISNSSDALDKLRYLTLTKDDFKSFSFDPKVSIEFQDGDDPTLTITDTGIGMSKKELQDNLGTIARSGTKNFLSKLSGDAKKDSQLIGQFGVGFYSSFMVADRVEVATKKAGNKESWKWVSDGESGFEIKKDVKKDNGTSITLYLNDEGKEFASRWKIESLIKRIGIFRIKSKSIYNLSKILVKKFNGKVPKTYEELESLPGVGHKTASVVMSQGFGKPAFPVDTHIHRLAQRWGLTNGKSVTKTEEDLKRLFPKKNWNKLHLQIIYYGREYCKARECYGLTCKICTTCYPYRKSPIKTKKA